MSVVALNVNGTGLITDNRITVDKTQVINSINTKGMSNAQQMDQFFESFNLSGECKSDQKCDIPN